MHPLTLQQLRWVDVKGFSHEKCLPKWVQAGLPQDAGAPALMLTRAVMGRTRGERQGWAVASLIASVLPEGQKGPSLQARLGAGAIAHLSSP